MCLAIAVLALSILLTGCRSESGADASAMDGLNADILSLTFGLNDVVYTLPFPVAELKANGWECWEGDDLSNHTIYPNSREHRFLSYGAQRIYVTFSNFTEEYLSFK